MKELIFKIDIEEVINFLSNRISTMKGKQNYNKLVKFYKTHPFGTYFGCMLKVDSGGYLLALATLAKKYKEVECVFCGNEVSIFWVNK